MRFLRRSLVGLFLVCMTVGLLSAAGYTFYSAFEEKAAQSGFRPPARERQFAVNAVTVEASNLNPVLSVFGEVRARRTLELRIPQGGELVEVSAQFQEGGAVKAGDVLLRVDPTDANSALQVATADLQEATVELSDAERGLEIAVDDLAAARAQLELRAGALERQRSLASRGVGTEASVETAALAEASALQAVLSKRQSLATATSRVDQGKNGVLRADINLSEAQRNLDETALIATFDGTLAGVSGALGTIVSANEQVGSLIDPNDLEVSFRVSTQQYGRMTARSGTLPDLPVTVSLDAAGIDLSAQGTISRESAAVESGQSGRLLFARLTTAPGLRSGDFVTVKVQELELSGVALLPSSAVDAANTVLVISDENRLELASAPILRRQDDNVIVDASEIAGLRIVAERSPLLGEGIRVAVNGDPKPEGRPEGRGERPAGGRNPAASSQAGDAPEADTTSEASASADTIELTDERRETLMAFVDSDERMPDEARARIKEQLAAPLVPASVVTRLESRMRN